MANSSATFTFALPEDSDSDYLQLWRSTSETTGFLQVGSNIAYSYGETTYEFSDIDAAYWYKIRFYNSTTGNYGPYSDPVFGADWEDSTKPFLAISSTSDGANYASIQDVRDYSGLTTDNATDDRVSQALRRSRAIIDLRTAEMDIDRFKYTFETDVARRKYNAALRVIKEAEIAFALGMIYRGLSDDEVLDGIASNSELSNVSIGSTSLTVDKSKRGIENASYFSRLAQKYTLVGTSMLALLVPSSVPLSWQENTSRYSRNAVDFSPLEWIN